MRAACIRGHGGPEAVEVADLPPPIDRAGWVRVRVRAAALNHLDLWVVKGGRAALAFPHVIGSDLCGDAGGRRVVANPGVSCGRCGRCLAGETSECVSFGLLGLQHPGVFAEEALVPEASLAEAPSHLSDEEAAALSLSHLTAWRMLFSRARLAPGETLLVHGVGGGVAAAAVQMAAAAGARVLVTSSSDAKIERALRDLGAASGVRHDREDVAAAALRFSGGEGVDVVLDTAGAATYPASLAALRKGGRLVLCGVTTGPNPPADLQTVYWKQISVLGSTMGTPFEYRAMLRFVEARRLRPLVDQIFPLAKARAAEERLAAGAQTGKIVLKIA